MICSVGSCNNRITKKTSVVVDLNDHARHFTHCDGPRICLECYKEIFIGKGENAQLPLMKLVAFLA